MWYSIIKMIHLLSVVIFLGNVITGLFWMHWAVRSGDLKIIHHTTKGIIRSDIYFTIPGAIIITISGLLIAMLGNIPVFKVGWLLWPIILFSLSGIIYFLRVVPLQKKIKHLTNSDSEAGSFDWVQFRKLYKSWDGWGIISVLTPLGAFVLMLLKIPV